MSERRELVDPQGKLRLRQQCEWLGLARSGLHNEVRPETSENLALRRRLDELHLRFPVCGSRRLGCLLASEGQEATAKGWCASCAKWGSKRSIPEDGRVNQG